MIAASSSFAALRTFLSSKAAGGIVLMAVAVLAMIVANSPFASAYNHVLHMPLGPELTPKIGPMTTHLWINDGLMAIFFLFVGLEIKRELVDGRLATWEQRRLPVIAAIGGMAAPALVYLVAAGGDPSLARGWAIPAATDIAFAVGVLTLLGPRAPTALKLFLVTVAIVDDMGAVAIIALFYTASIAPVPLVAAGVIFAGLLILNRAGVRAIPLYMLGFAALWYALLLSGVHATIAGVLAAFTVPVIPTPGKPDAPHSPLHRLEEALAGPVAFLIVPVFGFANAGVDLTGITPADMLEPLPLGVALGLLLGKQAGIFATIWLAVRTGIAARPRGATWLQVYGVALLCGIGFTMSLFIGGLAFADPVLVEQAKMGTLAGSIVSAALGFALLRFAPLHPEHMSEEMKQAAEIAADGDVATLEQGGMTR